MNMSWSQIEKRNHLVPMACHTCGKEGPWPGVCFRANGYLFTVSVSSEACLVMWEISLLASSDREKISTISGKRYNE